MSGFLEELPRAIAQGVMTHIRVDVDDDIVAPVRHFGQKSRGCSWEVAGRALVVRVEAGAWWTG